MAKSPSKKWPNRQVKHGQIAKQKRVNACLCVDWRVCLRGRKMDEKRLVWLTQ
mgnify:CR=1 FL=1